MKGYWVALYKQINNR